MSRIACDVVVIGGELCGLVAAALLARSGGTRVVVLEDDDVTDALPLGDRIAPTAPVLWRIPHAGPAAAVLETLAIKQDIRRLLADPVGLGIIDDPDIRMVVPVDKDARLRELARVFGAATAEAIGAGLGSIDEESRHGLLAEAALLHSEGFFADLFAKRKQRGRLELLGDKGRVDDDDGLVAQLQGLPIGVVIAQLAPFMQERAGASPLGLAGHLALGVLQAGHHAGARGGLGVRGALRDLLIQVIRSHRGEVHKERVEAIAVEGKDIASVKASGTNVYAARAVIDATSRGDLAARLPPGRRTDKLAAREAREASSEEGVVVRWIVPISTLPRGMPPCFVTLREAPARAALTAIYAGAPMKEGHKGAGLDENCVAVVTGTLCAAGQAAHAGAALEALLDRTLPFAREQMRARDVLSGPQLAGAMPRFAVPGDAVLAKKTETPFANLLRAGRDLAPGFGIDGELTAARSVVTAVGAVLGEQKSQAA